MAVKHIGTTGVKSVNVHGKCIYSGTGCNAAPMLREDMRQDADAYGSWSELVGEDMAPAHNVKFIVELQEVHDNSGKYASNLTASFRKAYLINMQALAKSHNLNSTELDALRIKWKV